MKSAEAAERLNQTCALTHAPPPENIQREGGVKCRSESSLTHGLSRWLALFRETG